MSDTNKLSLQVIDSDPKGPAEGDFWYNKDEDVFKKVIRGEVIVYRPASALRDLLRRLEWVHAIYQEDIKYCPCCEGAHKHKPSCDLAAALSWSEA